MRSSSEIARTSVAAAYVLVIAAFGCSGYFMIDSIARANESFDRVGQIIATHSQHDYDALMEPDVATPTPSMPAPSIPAMPQPTKQVKPAPAGCYVGGCSGQICGDQPGMVSTCEWREAYACYSGATCERQADGACGWTMDTELLACLDRAQ